MKSVLYAALLLAAAALPACDDSTGGGTGPRDSVDDAGPDARPPAPDAAIVEQTVEFTSPTEGAVIPAGFVNVEGTVSGPVRAVTVNDREAAVNQGRFTLRLQLDSGTHELVARAGDAEDRITITVDAAPPRIDITSPARATYTADGQTDLEFTITDDAGLAQVLFDGDLFVEPGLGPDFLLSGLPLAIGWNILRLQATDTAGNQANEHVSVLHGELQDPAVAVPAAIRLQIGPAGIDSLEAVVLELLARQDLTAFLPDPVFEGGPFRASVTDITYRDPPILEFTPTAGSLRVRARLEEAVLTLGLTVLDNEVYEVGAGAAAIEVTGNIIPRVVDGQLSVRMEDLELTFTDLQVQAGGVPRFEENPEEGRALIEEIAGQVITLVAERLLPDLVAGLLGRLDDPINLELLGARLQLGLVPDVIVVSELGLSARVSVSVALENPAPGAPALDGYIGTRVRWDGVPETDAVGIAIDDDLINLLFYQVWRAGVLFPRLDRQSDLGMQAGLVSSLLGSLVRRTNPDLDPETPIAIGTALPLPPVVRVQKQADAVGLVLGIGDMVVDVDTDDAAALDLLDGAASLALTASVGVTANEAGALALDLDVVDTVAAFDVTTPALRGPDENSVEVPLNDLLGRLGVILPGLLREVPIPVLDFVTFTDLRVDTVGPDGSFIGVFGNLAPPPPAP
ncbi:MAG: hypothetical protein KC583_23175 [Myxococcales bacterium]|nr:hypothetical protein [Myxococcales bacterium]MCA9561476.1 hypothetical protein [Myxococcales bacterium]MCB9546955.1 hypothetical protein [Myxococcales bacterium]